MPKYLSGRVKRTPQGSLTTDRYQYLGLEQAEPNLGDPPELDAVPGGQQYQVVSLIDRPGERFWVPIGGGIQPGSVTIRDEGLIVPRTDANPNLGISSITDINFIGSAVTAVGSINNDGSPGTAVTVTISPPGDNHGVLFNNDGEFATSPFFTFDNTTGIGSVGIGTSTPTQNLHVVGNIKLDKTIYGEDNQPGNTGNFLVKTATGGVKWISSGSVTSGAGGTITQIQFHDNTGLVGGASNFVFDSTNSRIGIGSTQPDRLLDVLGDSRFTGVTTFAGITTVTGNTLFTKQLNVAGVSTFNDDVTFTGANYNLLWDKAQDSLEFKDETKATFGNGRDLQISHTNSLADQNDSNGDSIVDGWTSYIHENGTGALVFKTDGGPGEGAYQFFDASWRPILKLFSGNNARAALYQGGTERLITTTDGIDVTGHTETDTLNVSGDVGIGTTNPTASNIESALESNTKVLAVGILTANQIYGNITAVQQSIDITTLNVSGVTSTKNLFVTGIATFEQGVSIGGTLTYEDVTNIDSIGIITARQGIHVGAGLSVVGISTFNDDIFIGTGVTVGFGTTAYFRDNAKLVFGTDQDLEIYHSGGNSFVKNTTAGSLLIQGDNIDLRPGSGDTGEVMLRATRNAGVEIRHDNTKRFATSGIGASVYGQLDVTDIFASGDVGIGTTNPSQKLEIYDGRVVVRNITDDAAKIVLRDDSGSYNHYQIRNEGGAFKIRNSGASPQYDAMTITSGGNLGIGTSGAYAKLEIGVGNETNSDTEYYGEDFAIAVRANRGNNAGDEGNGIVFVQKWDAASPHLVRTGAILGYKESGTGNFGGGLIFKTQEHGASPMSEKLRITKDGKVGIGTNGPDGKLHVFKGSAGNVTADSDANDIVIESDTDPGVSFLSPNNEQARIKFADPDDTDVGAITYDHASDTLSLIAGGTTVIGIGSTNTTIEGNLDVNGNITYSTMADVNSVGVITAQSGIHVTGAGVSVVGVSTFFDDLHILGSVGIGTDLTTSPSSTLTVSPFNSTQGRNISIYTNGTVGNKAGLLFNATPGTGNLAEIQVEYKGTNEGELVLSTSMQKRLTINKDGQVGIGTTNLNDGFTSTPENFSPKLYVLGDIVARGGSNYTLLHGGSLELIRDTSNAFIDFKTSTSEDLDCRIGATGANGLVFTTGGSNDSLTITSNGDVGIGSSGKLTIQPNPNPTFGVSEAIRIDQNNATDDRALQVFEFENSLARHHALTHNLRVYRYSASAYGYTQGKYSGSQMHEYAGGTYKIFTNPQASVGNAQDIVPTERFRLTSSGDVGIGTINPTGSNAVVDNNATLAVGILTARKIFGTSIVPDGDLLVDGNFKVTGVSTFVGVTTFGNVGIGGLLPDDFITNKFVVGDGGGSRGMTIYSDGTLGQIYFADGNSGDDRKRGGIVYDHSENELKFSVNAVEKFIIDSDGDVGIGTVDPTSKFDVHMSDKSGVNFLNISNNSAIDLKANQVESCGRIQVSESVGGGVMILSTKNTSGSITERLRINTNGDVTTTGDASFTIANAGFTARKGDSVSITRASGTPLEINRTTDDGELIKFYQDGAERANISIAGTDLVLGLTTERFRINSTGAKVTGNLVVDGSLTYEDVTNIETVGIITTSGGIDVTGGGIDVTNSSGIRVSGISTFYDNVNFQDRVLVGREVGTAIQGVVGHADQQLQVVGTGFSCGISIIRYSNDTGSGSLIFAKSKSPTIGTNTATQFGDSLGQILFNAADSSAGGGDLSNTGAKIKAEVTGTVSPGAEADIPTSLIFETSDNDTALHLERMRIRHDGLIGMGGTDRAIGHNSQYSRLIVCGNNDSTSGYGVLTIQAQSTVLHESTIGTLVFADRRGDFANITAFTDNTTGGSDFPGRLSFATTPDGATVPTNKLTILSGGNVGIGSEIPQYKLEVAGTVAATNFDSLSDRKVKTNIQIIQDPIEKIKKIDGVSFNWKSDNKPSLGVIADNVQSVLPEIVSNNDPKSVNYNGLIGLLIEVVKDQQKQIEELRGLIDK